MKKTLVAVAALAASAAFAQSSVTLYGVADAYFGSEKDAASQQRQTVVNSGGLSQSRVGISVKEDLGADLSAFAVYEKGGNLDKGTAANTRKAVLGLGGSFGAVSLGTSLTPTHDALEGILDAQSNSAFSALGAALEGDATQANYNHTYTDSIRYDSPNFEGFSGAVQVGLGEDKTAAVSAGRDVSLNLQYANGPIAVAYSHANEKAGGAKADKTNAVGGSYDFGAAKLTLGYIQGEDGATKDKYRVVNGGVAVPFDAFTVIAQVAQGKEKGTTGKVTSFGLEGRYALSKRTTTYAGLNNTQDKIGGGKVKTNRFGVGVRHVF